MTKQTGGPAFPVSTSDGKNGHQDGPNTWQCPGMSLRDYFAAKALQGLLAGLLADGSDIKESVESDVCEAAYDYADKMLKARIA